MLEHVQVEFDGPFTTEGAKQTGTVSTREIASVVRKCPPYFAVSSARPPGAWEPSAGKHGSILEGQGICIQQRSPGLSALLQTVFPLLSV
jgi:hypothetical protein